MTAKSFDANVYVFKHGIHVNNLNKALLWISKHQANY